MSKLANILLLALASFFFFIGLKSTVDSPSYDELTALKTITGVVSKLHCPHKGAAALSIEDSVFTFNLSVKFKSDYCNNDDSQRLLGKTVNIKAVQVNKDYYQVYQLKENEKMIISPEEVESDRANSTFGLFLMAFLIVALVAYKNKKKPKEVIQK